MKNERIMAVVMFSDVVGYTALMGEDESRALTLLQHYHQIQKSLVAHHGGTFVKEIGDGLLAYFNQTEQALSCCAEIQRQVRQQSDLTVRIGLNRADIFVENDDIYGDGVNIASRIEALADPGGIYFSDEVFNALPDTMQAQCEAMGKAKLKNVKRRVMIYALQGDGLPVPSRSRFQSLANPKPKLAAIPAVLIFLFVVGLIVMMSIKYYRQREVEEAARNEIDQVATLVHDSWRDYSQAYERALSLKEILPDDPRIDDLIKKSSVKININSEPEGARVFVKLYNSPQAQWEELGTTPIDSVRLPVAVFRWMLEKPGFEPVYAAATSFDFGTFTTKYSLIAPKDFFRKLDPVGSVPNGMTRVSGSAMPYGEIRDFFIDKYEVTNVAFKQFVDAAGYSDEKYWADPFYAPQEKLTWKEAMKLFVDKSGQPGPSTWINGTFPAGQDSFPVTGVSWYEARAYARFVNKDLPTGDHWGLARGDATFLIRWPQAGGYAIFAPFSNFNHTGPQAVGKLAGMTSFGAYDMAGNVREWCLNDSRLGKVVRGGAWNTNTYEFTMASQAPPFDRSETNGIRCALYIDDDPMPDPVFRLIDVSHEGPYNQNLVEPASDEAFNIYAGYYDYDDVPLDAHIVSHDESNPNWALEKITYKAPYNDETIIGYLFLPKNSKPPYQTVLYGPGSGALYHPSSDAISDYYEFPVFLDFIVNSGRALLFPVCQGTFERRSDASGLIHFGADTYQYTELFTQVVKDYRRSIDYLLTRNDIDKNNIAFYGMSWGPIFGTVLGAVEHRLKTEVFISGGLHGMGRPEVNISNFVTRVHIPTLLVNGRYDTLYPLDSYIYPLYRSLGVSENDKRLALFETDHIPPREGIVSETLAWFDKYMGKVDLTSGGNKVIATIAN